MSDDFAIPQSPSNILHWLGLLGESALTRPVKFRHKKREYQEPLWRAIQIGGAPVFAEVPVETALRAMGELWHERLFDGWYNQDEILGWYAFDHIYRRLGKEGRTWAPAYADEILERSREKSAEIPIALKWAIFLALVRAQIPIEARWDGLLPIEGKTRTKLSSECVKAIPAELRTAAILGALKGSIVKVSYKVPVAISLLRTNPSNELAQWILAHAANADGMTRKDVLVAVKAVGRKMPSMRALHDKAAATMPAPKKLTYERTMKVSGVTGLSEIQQKQIVKAAKDDGPTLPVPEAIALFEGTLKVGRLMNENGKHEYDVLRYMMGDGSIFKTGTATRVATIVQGCVEDCKSDRLIEAFEDALVPKKKR